MWGETEVINNNQASPTALNCWHRRNSFGWNYSMVGATFFLPQLPSKIHLHNLRMKIFLTGPSYMTSCLFSWCHVLCVLPDRKYSLNKHEHWDPVSTVGLRKPSTRSIGPLCRTCWSRFLPPRVFNMAALYPAVQSTCFVLFCFFQEGNQIDQ